MARLFLVFPQFTLAQYVGSVVIGISIILLVFFLVGQFINLIDRYQRTQPIVYDHNGKKLTIPQHVFLQLPGSVTRDLIKHMTEPMKKEAVVVEEEDIGIETINLPVIKEGHVLVVGPTDSGKTMAMRAIVKDRQNVVVIDPHNDSHTWGNIRVIGGGLNFEAIKNYLLSMDKEIVQRFTQRLQGKQHFEPLTVVVDELPAIISEIGKEFGAIWAKWIMQGRKVGLFVVMGSQSSRVAVLGIEGKGDILENFNYVITLGKKAQRTYKDLVGGMDRPAIIHSVDGVFPVIIPNILPTHFQNLYVAPRAIEDIESEWGTVTAEQIETILRMNREGESGRSIQENVFGYSGGHAFNRLKLVLEKHGGT